MSIKRNLDKVHVAVVTDTFNGGNFGFLLKRAAVSAITKGMDTPEWNKYMALFADNQQQLQRLTVKDPNEPDYFQDSRAYIVSNAVCGADTTGQTGQNVEGGFSDDPNIPNEDDGTVTKPFEIPPVG